MSPIRLLLASTLAVAVAEVAAIHLIGPLAGPQGPQQFLLELALMMMLVFPILYILTFRPMLRQISQRRLAEAALRHLSEDLESRITARTAELAAVNTTLMATGAERLTAEAELESERSFIAAVLDTAGALVIVLDREGRIVRFNRSCERTTGYSFEEVRGRTFWDFLVPADEIHGVKAAFAKLTAGLFPLDHENRWVARDGSTRMISWTNMALMDGQGEVEFVIGTGIDVTERRRVEELNRASLREKELLLKEIHHRVKNNLQIIASMLSLQADQLPDNRGIDVLTESQNRIRTMALVHEKLYRTENLSKILFGDYIEDLASYLLRSYRDGTGEIALRLTAAEAFLGIDLAIPIALIVNELVTNSIKHAFPGAREGTISIELFRPESGGLRLVVADDGIGFPGDLDFRSTRSLGLQIVCILVDQVGGTVEIECTMGTRFTITFGEPAQGVST